MDPSPLQRLLDFVEERRAAGTSQTALAKDLGIAQSTLSKILTGRMGVNVDAALAFERATARWRGGRIRVCEWRGYVPPERAASHGTGSRRRGLGDGARR